MTGVGSTPRDLQSWMRDVNKRLVAQERRRSAPTSWDGIPNKPTEFPPPARLASPSTTPGDYNECLETGIYWMNMGALNGPPDSDVTWYRLDVTKHSDGSVSHRAHWVGNAGGVPAYKIRPTWRRVRSSSGVWQEWVQPSPALDAGNMFQSDYFRLGYDSLRISSSSPYPQSASWSFPPTGGAVALLQYRDHWSDDIATAAPGETFFVSVLAKRIRGERMLNPRVAQYNSKRGKPGATEVWGATFVTPPYMEDTGVDGWVRISSVMRLGSDPAIAAVGLFLQIDQQAPYDETNPDWTQWLVSDPVVRRFTPAGAALPGGGATMNANGATASGRYWGANGAANFPDSSSLWFLDVRAAPNGHLIQEAESSTSTGSGRRVYRRVFGSSGWTAWRVMDVPRTSYTPAINGTIGNGSTSGWFQIANGLLTGGATITVGSTTTLPSDLQITKPLPDALPSNYVVGQGRVVGGSIVDSYDVAVLLAAGGNLHSRVKTGSPAKQVGISAITVPSGAQIAIQFSYPLYIL